MSDLEVKAMCVWAFQLPRMLFVYLLRGEGGGGGGVETPEDVLLLHNRLLKYSNNRTIPTNSFFETFFSKYCS